MPFFIDKAQFLYTCEVTGRKVYCGVILLRLMLNVIKPVIYINMRDLVAQLEGLTLLSCGNDVRELTTKMLELRQEIETQQGGDKSAMDDTRFISNLFRALNTMTNPDFKIIVKMKEVAHLEGTAGDAGTIIRCFNEAATNLIAENRWNETNDRKAKIITLTTKVKELESQRQRQPTRAQRERARRGGGANRGGGGGRGNGKPSSALRAPEWQITNVGPTTENPETGDLYRWCPNHTSKDGTVDGMYMSDSHDHTA